MNASNNNDFACPVVKLEHGDTFYKLMVSNAVSSELTPGAAIVITLIGILRVTGLYSVVTVTKTFKKRKFVDRSVHVDDGVAVQNIDSRLVKLQNECIRDLKINEDCKAEWDLLDLSGITDIAEQFERIKKWGKLKPESKEFDAEPSLKRVKCPHCGKSNYTRIPRELWMRLIPGTANYRCDECLRHFLHYRNSSTD